MARELVDLTLQEARAAIGGLRPPVLDDLGLAGGLASLARSIPQVEIDVDLADTRLPDHVEIAIYRIAQECLQNVVKHAQATNASLTFSVGEDTARLEIVDDGVGFDTFENPLGGDEMGGYGLLSMAERAEIVGGRLNIRSRPGSGTAVTATIPLPPSPARETSRSCPSRPRSRRGVRSSAASTSSEAALRTASRSGPTTSTNSSRTRAAFAGADAAMADAAGVGQHDVRVAGVGRLAPDQPALLHPAQVVRHPALLPLRGPAEFEGAQPTAGGLGEVDQDLEVGVGQSEVPLQVLDQVPLQRWCMSTKLRHADSSSSSSPVASVMPPL